MVRFTEHLLLTSCKPPAPTNTISEIVQKSFGTNHFTTDDLRKTQKFYELILVDTNSVILTHTFDKYHPAQILYSKCIIKTVITAQQWKNPFEERPFSISFPHKNIIIMITKMCGIAHSSFTKYSLMVL